MAEHRAEVDAIAARPWPPTFADTIEALERAGGRLHLAERLLADRSGAWSTPTVRALEAEMLPRLAAHRDAVGLDPRLFARACVLDRYHRDPIAALRSITGREPSVGPLLERRGLAG